MPSKLTYEFVKQVIEKENYILISDTYVDNKHKLHLICPKNHMCLVRFDSFYNHGKRCKICYEEERNYTFDEIKEYLFLKGYTLLSSEKITKKGKKYKLKVLCPEEHEYLMIFTDFKRGIRCRFCSRYKNHTIENIKETIEKEGYILLSKEYESAHTHLDLICSRNHKCKIPISEFQNGVRCNFCAPIRRAETCLKRYGVSHITQNKYFALKIAKACNKTAIRYHWKTNEELVCQGSYETKVVDFLNKNKINFLWQPEIFVMSNGKTYRPDLFLVNENKWIEIKGYMRKDAQEKWDWFKTHNPTAELWNQKKLKEIGIL